MMDIKFRAWDKEDEVMINWFWLSSVGNLYEMPTTVYDTPNLEIERNDNLIVMQYTGLKDKNGVEIYDGDILKCTSRIYTNLGATETGEYEETIKQVIWKDDSWGTRVINSNLTSKGAEKSGLVISAKYAEVIGNIYDNKDLLED